MGKEMANETANETKKLDLATKTRRCAIFMSDCYALAESLGEEDKIMKCLCKSFANTIYYEIGKSLGVDGAEETILA